MTVPEISQIPTSELYHWDGIRHNPDFYTPTIEPITTADLWIEEHHTRVWYYVATVNVGRWTNRFEPNVMIQIPYASVVIQTIGPDRLRATLRNASRLFVVKPDDQSKHKPLQAQQILAIYEPYMLHIWTAMAQNDNGDLLHSFQDGLPEAYLTLCGTPTYGGTFQEDY